MANSNSLKHASDQNHECYADDAKARRVLNVLDDGTPVDAANPLPISLSSDIEIGAVEIKDGTTDERANVDWDGFYSALAVTDGRMVFNVDDNDIAHSQIPQTVLPLNYGYEDTEGTWTRFLTEYDNGDVPGGQHPQLVLPLNYYWDAKLGAWTRWEGDSGSVWTYVVNLPATDYTDDGVFTVGSDKGVAIGGVATSDSVNPNDFGVLRITTDRSLVVTINNCTYVTDNDSISAGNESLITNSLNYGYNGSEWERITTDGAGNINTAITNQLHCGLVEVAYDHVGVTYPVATTEVYVFKTGGAGGTTVATVTLVYTDATKDYLSSATKT